MTSGAINCVRHSKKWDATVNLRRWAIANRVHPVTAYRWLREGKLPVPATRVGALILIDQPAGGTRTGVTVAAPVCHPLTSAKTLTGR